MDTDRLEALVRQNPALADLLDRFDTILLPDAWIVAGCLAQTVWNLAAGRPPGADIGDIDLIYHDPSDLSAAAEAAHATRLRTAFPGPPGLDVVNQARVHLWYEAAHGRPIPAYPSSAAAIASFPATCTSIGVRAPGGRFEICAPFGLSDLFSHVLRRNPALAPASVFAAKAARWRAAWPFLTLVDTP